MNADVKEKAHWRCAQGQNLGCSDYSEVRSEEKVDQG